MTDVSLASRLSNKAWEQHTSALKSSKGNPSTALMLSCEPGCTMANPPETKDAGGQQRFDTNTIFLSPGPGRAQFLCQASLRTFVGIRTEVLLASTALLNDLYKPRLQLFNGRYMVGKDTHISRFSRYIDLHSVNLHRSQPNASSLCAKTP